jgi:hypothetical protein
LSGGGLSGGGICGGSLRPVGLYWS